jgi:hypothetical protein
MQNYPGTNGSTIVISTTPGAAGISGGVLTVVLDNNHGIYPKNILSFAGDVRNDTDLNAGPQGNKDAIVWLAYRTLDWIYGGDYRGAFTGFVLTSCAVVFDHSTMPDTHGGVFAKGGALGGPGGHFFAGSNDTVDADGVDSIGSRAGYGVYGIGGSIGGGVRGDGGATGGDGVTGNGTGNGNGVTAVGVGTGHGISASHTGTGAGVHADSMVITGPLLHSGATATNGLREIALPITADSSNHFDPSQGDIIYFDASGITADRTWTLDPPGVGEVVTVLFYPTNTSSALGHNLHIVDGNTSSAIYSVNTGSAQTSGFRIYYSIHLGKWLSSVSLAF